MVQGYEKLFKTRTRAKVRFFLQQVETCKKLEGDEDEYR